MAETALTDKAKAVLDEIYMALGRLLDSGESWTIFINKMALTQEERLAIRDYLGQGNLRINLEGSDEPAEWQETGISGVWYGVFYDQSRNPMLETIEVGFFPQVAAAQPEDLKKGMEDLKARY